jgi:hypothetical protein
MSQSLVKNVIHLVYGTHHQRMSFQDELRELFNRHGIAFDERYVWD